MAGLGAGLLDQTLNSAGYSKTLPRKFVFNLLENQPPQTVAELASRCHGKIDRASLYRTLNLFEKLGIINKVYIGWKYKLELGEQFSSHHHHVYCARCGQIVDVKEPPHLKGYIDSIARRTGFIVRSHAFEINGVCPPCQKAGDT